MAGCFNLFLKQIKPSTWSELLRVPIRHNCLTKVGGNVVLYENLIKIGIILINDLLDVTGELINVNTFRKNL